MGLACWLVVCSSLWPVMAPNSKVKVQKKPELVPVFPRTGATGMPIFSSVGQRSKVKLRVEQDIYS